MKQKFIVFLAALLFAGALAPTTSEAVGFYVEIGDRHYYRHGPYYWHRGTRWYWVPGHWRHRYHHRVWVHGYYAPRY